MQKIYATSTVISDACMLPKDYSYVTNGKCNECKFCYKLTDNHKQRLHLSKYIDEESKYSENLYLAPILISRYCEPFLNETYIRHSLYVADHMIKAGSQVIFRTDGTNLEHPDIIDFLKSNKQNVQVQLKVFVDDTVTGMQIHNDICPNRVSVTETLRLICVLEEHGINPVVFVDPYILGVNDNDIQRIAFYGSQFGLRKIIIKQLFATDYFFNYLSISAGRRCVNLLTDKVGKYTTYNTYVLLAFVRDLLEITEPLGIDVSFCMNKEANEVLGIKYNNCCMFENPCGVYDLSVNLRYRKNGSKIIRNNDAVYSK